MSQDRRFPVSATGKRTLSPRKAVDERYTVKCASGARAIYREEVWEDRDGAVVKYRLAFIHHGICQKDNGRVLGYDNTHGHHERHFMGKAQQAEFVNYTTTLSRFQQEVAHYRETT